MKKIFSIIICSILVVNTLIGHGFALNGLKSNETKINDISKTISGTIDDVNETNQYNLEVNHEQYPLFIVGFYLIGQSGSKLTAEIYDGDKRVAYDVLSNSSDPELLPNTKVKRMLKIENDKNEVKNYKIIVSSSTGNVSYKLAFGSIDEVAELLGGEGNIIPLEKNISSSDSISCNSAQQAFLNVKNVGEYYSYIADGETYITLCLGSSLNPSNIKFEVIDAETKNIVFISDRDNYYSDVDSGITFNYLQAKLNLEKGHEYLLHIFSPNGLSINKNNLGSLYKLYLGFPFIEPKVFSFRTNTVNIPANKSYTFSFNVSGYLNSARVVKLNTGMTYSGAASNIISTKLVAPNGQVFEGTWRINGIKPSFYPEIILDKQYNTPLNGKWTVTIKSRKSFSTQFILSGSERHIVGNYGN